jgi:glutamyl-tRNA synthetase
MFTDIAEKIRKAAILNAIRHGGKASTQAVLGNLLGDNVELRNRARELLPLVEQAVAEVNGTPQEQLRETAEKNWPTEIVREHVEGERKLPPLPNAAKYSLIVTRIAPNPDFVLHLGNARAAILSHDYARMYKGKFIVRFEDTDPRLKKAQLGYYDMIRQDLKWIGCDWDEECIQSDRLPLYYKIAEILLQKEAAYVCECERDRFHDLVTAGTACPDRSLPANIQLQRWKKMLEGGYMEEKAVFRVKTDLAHPNPAVRDWPAFRVIDAVKNPHPRVGSKYTVWPLYNMASGVDDHELGITHVIRGKEHLTNMARQIYLYRHLGWKYPDAVHFGRLKVEGMNLSKSKLMKGLETGEYTGVDDPRLGTLAALRRRGYNPETIRTLIWDIGPKPVDVTISWDNINSLNRKIIDPTSHRYYFVPDPILAKIGGVQRAYDVKAPLHPQHPEMGLRNLNVQPSGDIATIYLSGSDQPTLQSEKVVRLMGLFNFEPQHISGNELKGRFLSDAVAQDIRAPILQWVPADQKVPAAVVMPDASRKKGLAEKALLNEHVGFVVQLVRFGFGRVDRVEEDGITIYYAHE